MASISLQNISKVYPGGAKAVSDINLDIADGEFIVLVGPSGCGKSTLLRMVAGLETISAGSASIGDRKVNNVEPADRDIAMVFQNYALYPHMSVYNNLAYGLKNQKTPRAEIDKRIQAAAKMLEIEQYLERKPRALSGGQRQRVAMGRAIVREPKAFLFDEPLSNLDAKLRVSMRGEIKHLQKRLGTTSLYVTHDQLEAMTLADRLVVLNAGRIEQIGTPLEVYHTPASTFVANFIGSPAMNLVSGEINGNRLAVGYNVLQPGGSLPADGPVTVGIRAEDLQPYEQAGMTLKARLDYIEELGATRLAHCLIGEQKIIAALSPEIPLAEEVTFSVDPDKLHFYDANTGKRINRSATPPDRPCRGLTSA
ncbi:sn-glycerol-3-phosphate import ATP-binding protein UgpC [Martelella endophytica]|uniref:Glycerol-3-phosphate transporter ATP-binding subunit n=1 Tax=Martelella endophytica TaxID=1486262 RepID=A0A0D5LU36_MAREN|nr:sn-glycerol-3-phosphate import ATP-binding protein UgpC [Martelella endophytica]AJY47576.1 glycerol-3-phosphate transporter ATP-binding subunit [Martelella endophytica]